MALRAISLFAGVGGLDLGVRLALPEARTICYVERELYAAAVLAARMEEGSLDVAPVYSDIETFDARPWRGEVDLVHGGIPCQPYSLAGERKGDEDERALWPEFARVVAECRPSLVFIENVPAFVMGGGFRPLGEELCRLGYELEDPIFLRASDVGAPHIRERVFILAHHLADTEGLEWRECLEVGGQEGRVALGGSSGDVADGSSPRFRVTCCGRKPGKRFLTPLGNDAHRRDTGLRGEGEAGGEPVPDAECDGLRERAERGDDRARETVTWHAQPFPVGLFPPGPKDLDEWEQVLEVAPWLAPPVESGVRLLVNGVALVVDENRAHQLRCTGNGVVPAQAGWALMILLEWAGITNQSNKEE